MVWNFKYREEWISSFHYFWSIHIYIYIYKDIFMCICVRLIQFFSRLLFQIYFLFRVIFGYFVISWYVEAVSTHIMSNRCILIHLGMRPRYSLRTVPTPRLSVMTSLNGNIFRVTGHLYGEFTGHRWIPRTKASDAELWYFLWSAPE